MAIAVRLVTEGIRVAGHVEPLQGQPFPKCRRGQQRSTTFSNASGEESARKASTSAGAGGSPVKSKLARRIQSTFGVGSDGLSPSRSRRAIMK